MFQLLLLEHLNLKNEFVAAESESIKREERCRRIGIFDRRRGPSSLGLPEGVKESVVKVGIVHGNYPASDLATAARSYVLL